MTTRDCCLGCGKPGATNVCTGCHVACYCDDTCADKGWEALHAVACKHFNAFGGRKKFNANLKRPLPHFDMVLPRGTRKSEMSVKIVGTLMDLATEVLGEKYAEAYPFRKVFEQIPLLSWFPTANFELMTDQELANWIFNVMNPTEPRERESVTNKLLLSPRARESLIVSAKLLIRGDPIAFSRQGVFIANWTGDHALWREGLIKTIATRNLVDANDLNGLYHEWKKAATPLIQSKLEKRNLRPVIAPGAREEQEMLVNFAKANPLSHYMILHGLPHTNLADLVFQRLYGKLQVWLRVVDKSRPVDQEWTNKRALRMLILAFKSGRFFLVEKGPREFGGTDSHAFTFGLDTRNEKGQPLLAITLGFRKYFNRGSNVYDEETLFQLALHEIAHLLQNEHATYRGEDNAKYQDDEHNLSFYRAFIFVYAMAQRAGLVSEARSRGLFRPFAMKPPPNPLTKEILQEIHDAVNFVTMATPDEIEAEIHKDHRGAKRTLEPDDASYLSDSDFGGRKKKFEQHTGFEPFLQVLYKVNRRHRGQVHTNTATLCDEIIQIVYSCLPGYDLDAIDTLGWHASVKEDLADHADDEPNEDIEEKQLFRNLPPAIADLFETDGDRIVREVPAGAGNARVSSVAQLDRSRLVQLPHDLQLMLLEELPAYSILAVIEDLPIATRKTALLLLLDRDIFTPLARSKMPRETIVSGREERRAQFDGMSYPHLLIEYKSVASAVTAMLVSSIWEPVLKKMHRSVVSVAESMTLEGRHFALTFTLNGRGAWTVHPVVSKRFFKILPDSLGVAIRNFSALENQKTLVAPEYLYSRPFYDLVMLVVETIDASVGWRVTPWAHYQWPKFTWLTHNGIPYIAPLNMLVAGPETAYRLVAERSDHSDAMNIDYVRKGTPIATMEQRLMD